MPKMSPFNRLKCYTQSMSAKCTKLQSALKNVIRIKDDYQSTSHKPISDSINLYSQYVVTKSLFIQLSSFAYTLKEDKVGFYYQASSESLDRGPCNWTLAQRSCYFMQQSLSSQKRQYSRSWSFFPYDKRCPKWVLRIRGGKERLPKR